MTVRRLVILSTLAVINSSASFAQNCEKIEQRDADAILGGSATPLGLGAIGCSYSVRGKAARLTMTLGDEGANAKKTYESNRRTAKNAGWFVNDELLTLGYTSFSESIKPSGPTAAKIGFIVMKGSKIIQFYITDSSGTVVRRETLEKLRPIARRSLDRI